VLVFEWDSALAYRAPTWQSALREVYSVNLDELNRLLGKHELGCKHNLHEHLARALFYERKAGVAAAESAQWHGLAEWEVDLFCAWYEMGCKK
jgi:hypothetical protein